MPQPPSPQPDDVRPSPADQPADPPDGPPRFSREADDAWRAFAYLLTGPLTFGGIGWLIDRWAGTGWLTPVGIVGGMALSLYLIWFRYGTH
jgi:hypothetical protein